MIWNLVDYFMKYLYKNKKKVQQKRNQYGLQNENLETRGYICLCFRL